MNIEKYFKYYNDLDEDLQNLILSKIRYPQNKNLQLDIINYNISKEKIINKYLKMGYDYDIDNEFYIYFQIENDLIRYFNDDVATMNGITETNIEKLERILSIRKKMNSKNKSLIATNLMYKNNISANMRINILIGCLTINERDDFINNFK
tara:strand:- start:167 stop:619 length:453 start_codon:yes stop_codon:yes gene_type:complete